MNRTGCLDQGESTIHGRTFVSGDANVDTAKKKTVAIHAITDPFTKKGFLSGYAELVAFGSCGQNQAPGIDGPAAFGADAKTFIRGIDTEDILLQNLGPKMLRLLKTPLKHFFTRHVE